MIKYVKQFFDKLFISLSDLLLRMFLGQTDSEFE